MWIITREPTWRLRDKTVYTESLENHHRSTLKTLSKQSISKDELHKRPSNGHEDWFVCFANIQVLSVVPRLLKTPWCMDISDDPHTLILMALCWYNEKLHGTMSNRKSCREKCSQKTRTKIISDVSQGNYTSFASFLLHWCVVTQVLALCMVLIV